MNLEEATKKVRAEKPKDNYMVIKLDARVVVPHSDGMALLASLARAEKWPDYYSSNKHITEFDRNSLETTVMSPQEYDRHKIAALLNCTPDEVREAQQKAREQQHHPVT